MTHRSTIVATTLILSGSLVSAQENATNACLFDTNVGATTATDPVEDREVNGATVEGTTIAGSEFGGETTGESTLGGPNSVTVTVPQITFPTVNTPTTATPQINLPSFRLPGAALRQTDRYTIIALGADILFDFDQSTLRPDAQTAIAKVAKAITENCAGLPITVHGHTDAKGPADYNQTLSEARALSVQFYLAEALGISDMALGMAGHGETDPIAPNTLDDGSDNPAGRQQNRRVEIWIDRAG